MAEMITQDQTETMIVKNKTTIDVVAKVEIRNLTQSLNQLVKLNTSRRNHLVRMIVKKISLVSSVLTMIRKKANKMIIRLIDHLRKPNQIRNASAMQLLKKT